MKRASLNFHQSHTAVDEEAKAKLKYQALLNDYLELQKEFVSKKRKLTAAKQKREKFSAEVRFLRQRYKHLYRIKASNNGKDLLCLQNSINAIEGERSCGFYEAAAAGNSDEIPILDSTQKKSEEHGEPQVLQKESRFPKRPTNDLISDKVVGKRKITQHDQFTFQL